MNNKISLWWALLLGIVMFLFTVQPYSFRFGEIPLQVVLVWFLLFWQIFINFSSVIHAIGRYNNIQKVVIVFIVMIFSVKLFYEEVTYTVFFQLFTGISLSILAIIVSENIQRLKLVLNFVYLACFLSAIVCFLQFLGLADWSWNYTAYYSRRMILPTGLEYNPVALTYSLLSPSLILLIGYFYQKANRIKVEIIPRFFSFPILALLLLSMLLSQSRSGVLAIVVCVLLVMGVCHKLKRNFLPLSAVISIATVFIILIILNNNIFDGIINKTEKVKNDMRTAGTWEVFYPVISKYPFGVPENVRNMDGKSIIGGNSTKEYKVAMKKTDGYDPHNLLITTAVYFGLPAAILLFIFYLNIFYGAFKQVFRWKLVNKSHIYHLIFLAANIAILIHGWFHNANIFFGEMRLWFWLGLLVSYTWGLKIKLSNNFSN